jgi:Zn-dependent metalloprotease
MQSAEQIARGFLRTHKDLYGFSDQEVDALQIDAQYTDAHNGVTHVFYKQLADGIPVYPASLSVHLNARGQVLGVAGDVFPGVRAPAAAALTQERAAELAAQQVGVDYHATRVGAKADKVELAQRI